MRSSLLLLCLLTGCVVGPNYVRPPLDIPETYTYETPEATLTLDTAWWEQFGDPVLTDLIKEAASSNFDIKAAAAQVDKALGFLIQVNSTLYPQTGYNGSFTRTRQSVTAFQDFPVGTSFPNPYNTYQALFTGTWDLDLFGRIKRQVEAARAQLFATDEARRAVLESVVALTANTYIQLLGLDAQLLISKETLKAYQDEVTYFEHQFNYGQASMMMVVQARTQQEIAASTIPQVELQIVQTENALSVLLGKNPAAIPRGKTIYDLTVPTIPEGIPSDILCQRPDVREAEFALITANAQIGAAKALYYPDITLTGAYGNMSLELSNLFTGPSRAWTYTGSLVGPIFTFGNIYGQVEQAIAEYETLLYNYQNTIIQAFADVENALSAHTFLQRKFEAQKKLVDASGQYVYYAQLQFKGGYSPYFVVLQAQEQYFPAQLSWVETRADLFTSVINAYEAMGGGWIDIIDPSLSCNE
jgi:multidrug efflux system outer membrane protein